MKKIKILFIIYIVYIVGLGGCIHGGSCDIEPSEFDIQSMRLTPYKIISIYSNGTYFLSSITSNTILDLNQLVLTLRSDINYVKANTIEFNFISSAYASSCPDPGIYTDERIASINITSDSDFSIQYPAGSNLNDLFNVAYVGNLDFVGGSTIVNKSVNDYVATTPSANYVINIELTSLPDISKTHTFKIEYTQTNGEYYEFYTNALNFK